METVMEDTVAKIRVTRTLVYEGDEEWVRASTDPCRTIVSPDKPVYSVIDNTIIETERKEETLPDA
jgi:hypothetical protein